MVFFFWRSVSLIVLIMILRILFKSFCRRSKFIDSVVVSRLCVSIELLMRMLLKLSCSKLLMLIGVMRVFFRLFFVLIVLVVFWKFLVMFVFVIMIWWRLNSLLMILLIFLIFLISWLFSRVLLLRMWFKRLSRWWIILVMLIFRFRLLLRVFVIGESLSGGVWVLLFWFWLLLLWVLVLVFLLFKRIIFLFNKYVNVRICVCGSVDWLGCVWYFLVFVLLRRKGVMWKSGVECF